MIFTDLAVDDRRDIIDEADDDLYNSVIEHRRKFIGLKGFDYETLRRPSLKIVPTGEIRDRWESDYKSTVLNMVMGPAPSFEEIIIELEALNVRINRMK